MEMPVIRAWRVELDGPVNDFAESIFFIGNGFLGVRGFSLQEPKQNPQDHAIFRAGFFESVKPGITDMVQLPDVMGMRVERYQPKQIHQELDLRYGLLTRTWRENGLTVSAESMVSMADPQLICIRMTLTADSERTVHINAELDDRVENLPVCDDQTVEEKETVCLLRTEEKTDHTLLLRAIRSGRRLYFRRTLTADGNPVSGAQILLKLKPGIPTVVENRIRILTEGEKENAEAADIRGMHMNAWDRLWRDCDIELDAEEEIQGALRWNIFQMLCNNAADDAGVSIGARGLTHGRYKGNAFWDTDVFLQPFFCWCRPGAAANLSRYRLNRLPQAKELAAKQNLNGARYPWMCAADGTEQCESWDIGLCEVHITADIAYALCRTVEITGMPLTEKMRELLAETARYWKSRFTWEENRQQYSCFFVKGPDEYCGAAVNNTYTNYMARHNVEMALLYAGDRLTDEEREELRFFADHIAILYDQDRELYLQDELFDRMEPLPAIRQDGEPLYKSICFDRMQRYRALKQADLVELMVLFPEAFTEGEKRAVWEIYEPLTVHDSSLSFGVHAHLGFQLGIGEKAWDYFVRSVTFDLRDRLHNTGREGVHMASLGASWQAVVYGMLGLWAHDGRLMTRARLPEQIRGISLSVYYRGERYQITSNRSGTIVRKEA